MNTTTYLGAVCGHEGSYGIVFMDFPGCISAGDTLDEVLEMGREALQGHIEIGIDYGDPIPEPSQHTIGDVADWLRDDKDGEDDDEWLDVFPIDVVVSERPTDVHVDLPRGLLNEIDMFGKDQRKFLIEVAQRELTKLRKTAA